MRFRWIGWNINHLAEHGVDLSEAEAAVESAESPYPRRRQDDKWLVWGRGRAGRWLQVVFLLDDAGEVFVIHARPLTDNEKRRRRRQHR